MSHYAEEADRLCGPQHDLLWADELAAWQNCQDTWDMAMFGLRLGSRPRWLALAKTEAFERSRRDRKRVEMLFAHLKRIFRLGRLRWRGPCGAQFEFTLAAIAQNLRRLGKLIVRPRPVAEACLA
jgi:hypothetical protein